MSERAGDLGLLTWTRDDTVRPPAEEAVEAYAALDAVLTARGLSVVQERMFGGVEIASRLRAGRAEALAASQAGVRWPVAPTIVDGAPPEGQGLSGIHVIAVRGASRVVGDGARIVGTVVETDTARVMGLSDVGRRALGEPAQGPAAETADAIVAAEQLLLEQGFAFTDVTRTWFYLRDILDWYGSFNAARNAAFERMGLPGRAGGQTIPASTGIGGRTAGGGWCTLDLLALRARRGHRLEVKRLYGRAQNEATEYGSAFARAVEVGLGDARYIFVSGTAAIDHRGASVHGGDFEKQVRFTLDAVEALIEPSGARLEDVRQATAFLKRADDASVFEGIRRGSPLAEVPVITTVADVCRAELLFEMDAVVVVAS